MSGVEQIKKNKKARKKKRKRIIIAGVTAALFAILVIILLAFKTEKVTYLGNVHISAAKLDEEIFAGKYPNSLFYKFISGNNKKKITYVENYTVTMKSPNELEINIKEVNMIFYIALEDGKNAFVDDKGQVVAITNDKFEDIPRLVGVSFDKVEEGVKLGTSSNEALDSAIAYGKALKEYPKKNAVISVDEENKVTIKIGKIKVACGSSANASDKIARFDKLLPKMKGLQGTLHLEEFDGSQTNIYFNKSQ